MKLRLMGTIGLAAALALTACGGGGGESASEGPQTLVGTTDLKYQPTSLTAPAGKEFTIELDNQAVEGIPHNFVIVRQGQEDAVAQESAADEGEVDADGERIFYASDFVEGGESEEFEVGELEAGTYGFVCTYPGHAAGMKGTLTVQ